jgi:protein gp37
MSEHTGIEWTDATWNPWHGCHKVSPGCKFCYMYREKHRYGQDPNVVNRSKTKFTEPLKWITPRMVFTCSWSDWLIEEADQWREQAYEIIRMTKRHIYQILTKRPERAAGRVPIPPLPNIWFGVSVENRATLHRVDTLREIPAELRFLSLEPLLEDLGKLNLSGIDWVIAGGESGPGARASSPDWFRSIRDQCQVAAVPFFFKQWGEFVDWDNLTEEAYNRFDTAGEAPRDGLIRIGKKAAGALLDGREWREFPKTATPRV